MSLIMRKPAFCICENKDADQLFAVNAKLISAFVYKPLAIFPGRAARFVSDLVGNREDWFSHNEAHI